jgi:DNA (cytosine-5)-methyltransferase 1
MRDDLAVLRHFIFSPSGQSRRLNAVSLYSGAGLSDIGYALAGFAFHVQAEIEPRRAALCTANFPLATPVIGDLRSTWRKVLAEYEKKCNSTPELVAATPPCQGMSSSNPGRGKVGDPDSGNRDGRNLLILPVARVVEALEPRIVVIENVPQLLLRTVRLRKNGRPRNVVEAFLDRVPGYRAFADVVQMADYGIPQVRRRSVLVLVREGDPVLAILGRQSALPWPQPTHAAALGNCLPSWVTLDEWFRVMNYLPLDAKNSETAVDPDDPLHRVPHYLDHRYSWAADIPRRSGANAYQNPNCHACGRQGVPAGRARCDRCGKPMLNRPHVRAKNGRARLIKGFLSSYRRMKPDRPAPTITTASSHLGSDYTIHPWENRVLSVRECADLQTVPRTYDWSWALGAGFNYMLRQVIGEAIPPWFTYLHGLVLRDLLAGRSKSIPLAKRSVVKRFSI